ncbi:glycosyltransferase family 1 protein [Saccharobesus litoralis]|uniref:Glycosyltransferase family 1 protein n=1 Tax=Saccharobesus litoralis TaxID=2172099 RepID=A0A2S0VM41_9ALTE|nr:glycosyltransferase family 4 protein [Saccharobesus litoralis]AWB65265.1 glycosyltransferase family 1 protein [Saccharobesus litoralis]
MNKHLGEIWQVVDSRNFGGIESHILQLSQGLQIMGLTPRVVFLNHYGEHPLFRLLKKANIPYLVRKACSIQSLIKTHQPALIHTHGYKAGIVMRIIGRLSGTPVISTYHAGETPKGKVWLYDWIDRYTGHLAKWRFAVSASIQQKLPTHAEQAKNFINSRQLTKGDGQQVAFVGRLSFEKGINQLIAIAKQLPHVDIHVYGDGPAKQQLLSARLKNLHLHGQQHHMPHVWRQIGLLLLPSLQEGLPMVALEAMARGIPVVASRVGALPELITHKKNGWLINVGDIHGYCQAIMRWHALPAIQQASLSRKAKKVVDTDYSVEAVMPHFIQRYRQAMCG